MSNPIHGDERNHRTQTDYSKSVAASTPDGQKFNFPSSAHTYSVVERYCGWCGDWKETKGIIGAIVCMDCRRDWHDVPQS